MRQTEKRQFFEKRQTHANRNAYLYNILFRDLSCRIERFLVVDPELSELLLFHLMFKIDCLIRRKCQLWSVDRFRCWNLRSIYLNV